MSEPEMPTLDPTRSVPPEYRDVQYTLNYESDAWDEAEGRPNHWFGPLSVAVSVRGGLPLGFLGWCADEERFIDEGAVHSGVLYSSYEPLPESANIVHPENLDAANYLVNAYPVGAPIVVPGSSTPFEVADTDMQAAMWFLLSIPVDAFGEAAVVSAMVAEALANGEGFVPGPGTRGLLLVVGERMENGQVQPLQTLALNARVPFDCYTDDDGAESCAVDPTEVPAEAAAENEQPVR